MYQTLAHSARPPFVSFPRAAASVVTNVQISTIALQHCATPSLKIFCSQSVSQWSNSLAWRRRSAHVRMDGSVRRMMFGNATCSAERSSSPLPRPATSLAAMGVASRDHHTRHAVRAKWKEAGQVQNATGVEQSLDSNIQNDSIPFNSIQNDSKSKGVNERTTAERFRATQLRAKAHSTVRSFVRSPIHPSIHPSTPSFVRRRRRPFCRCVR